MSNILDLREVFVQDLDNSKGYDTDRTLNSYQADSCVSHNHEYKNQETSLSVEQQ